MSRSEPDPADEEWLLGLCSERERQLYKVSSRTDRRHAIDCARRAQALLDASPAAEVPNTTPTADAPNTTPTAEAPNTTPTAEAPNTTPTAEAPNSVNIIVAAALHDVGKTPARLSTLGRVAATLSAPFVAEHREFASPAGLWKRFGVYKAHPTIGAELLAAAGSDQLVIDWAQQHHRPASQRTIDPPIAAILEQAD